jgi:hypothetical protein
VTRDQQLQWEARWARPAGIAAILSALLLLVSAMAFFPKDRKGIEANPDLLLSIDQESGSYLFSEALSALAVLLLSVVFYYLFRAIVARGGGVPSWFVYLVFAGPLLYAASRIAGAFEAIDLAEEFVDDGIIRGQRGEDHASELSGAGPVLVALATAGTVALAFLFVMLPLRARRVGLLTPFMGILGAIAGALIIIPLASVSSVIQAFWLGAVGALFLGRWPGGRGPAWETGEAEPWPTAAERRGLVQPRERDEEPAELDPSLPPEPEPLPDRPASRKRKKKR